MSWLSKAELLSMGFYSVGNNVKVSRKASFYGPERISLGNNARIDDFSVISSGEDGIRIGNNVHIAIFSSIQGALAIEIQDYVSLSSRVSLYSHSDNFNELEYTGPMSETIGVKRTSGRIQIGEKTIVGCGSVVLPGVIIEENVSVGALSLVKGVLKKNGIYAGIPVKKIGLRT